MGKKTVAEGFACWTLEMENWSFSISTDLPSGTGGALLVRTKTVEIDPTGRFTRTSQLLGGGSSKTVYLGYDREKGIEVAWNQVRLTDTLDTKGRDRLLSEVELLKRVKHPRIMAFYACWVDNDAQILNFITEYFQSGTLRRHRWLHRQVPQHVRKKWAWQVLQGLIYLHGLDPPIIHRDLKCDNIFVHGMLGEVKIGDFGLARIMEEGLSVCATVVGTPEFMAPELYDEMYNEKVDIYAFGMCLLELETLQYPYSECKNVAQIFRQVSQGIPPQSLARVKDPESRKFIELCINREAAKRPSAKELSMHPFFDNIRRDGAVFNNGNASVINTSSVFLSFDYGDEDGAVVDSESFFLEDDESLKNDPIESYQEVGEFQLQEAEHTKSIGTGHDRFAKVDTIPRRVTTSVADSRFSFPTIADEHYISAADDTYTSTLFDSCPQLRTGEETKGVGFDFTRSYSDDKGDGHKSNAVRRVATNHSPLGEKELNAEKRAFALKQMDQQGSKMKLELTVLQRDTSQRFMFPFDLESDTIEGVALEVEDVFSLDSSETRNFTGLLSGLVCPQSKRQDHECGVLALVGLHNGRELRAGKQTTTVRWSFEVTSRSQNRICSQYATGGTGGAQSPQCNDGEAADPTKLHQGNMHQTEKPRKQSCKKVTERKDSFAHCHTSVRRRSTEMVVRVFRGITKRRIQDMDVKCKKRTLSTDRIVSAKCKAKATPPESEDSTQKVAVKCLSMRCPEILKRTTSATKWLQLSRGGKNGRSRQHLEKEHQNDEEHRLSCLPKQMYIGLQRFFICGHQQQ